MGTDWLPGGFLGERERERERSGEWGEEEEEWQGAGEDGHKGTSQTKKQTYKSCSPSPHICSSREVVSGDIGRGRMGTDWLPGGFFREAMGLCLRVGVWVCVRGYGNESREYVRTHRMKKGVLTEICCNEEH